MFYRYSNRLIYGLFITSYISLSACDTNVHKEFREIEKGQDNEPKDNKTLFSEGGKIMIGKSKYSLDTFEDLKIFLDELQSL